MKDTDIAAIGDRPLEVNHPRVGRLDDSLFSKELAPHYMKLAGQLAASELVPKSFRNKPQDLFLCWALGYQIGMSPEQAMQCIAIVNGKAVMWGDEMLALCMSHREFDDIIENPILKDDAVIGYSCVVKRKGKSDKQSVFTLEMAKKAGLLSKPGVWNQYPERMLKLRARGFCLRDAFPDALKGIKSREEVEDYVIDAEYTPATSRTERLKHELITKKGAENADMVDRPVAINAHQMPIEEAEKDEEHRQEATDSGQAVALHIKAQELVSEKGLDQQRLSKALAYYEVSRVEDMSIAAAKHFIEQLTKSQG